MGHRTKLRDHFDSKLFNFMDVSGDVENVPLDWKMVRVGNLNLGEISRGDGKPGVCHGVTAGAGLNTAPLPVVDRCSR